MLQTRTAEIEHAHPLDGEPSLDLSYYAIVLKKRIFFLLIPFLLVLTVGVAAALLWPPTYLSEGKILVESQQIPTELVRPTVTTGAKERIQVIQQRVLTRENLLTIADKYRMYPSSRDRLSRTELLDLMRENIRIEPIDLDRAGRAQTIALSVGFTDQRPDVATRVANDLLTLFLNEDARNRTIRATETSRFLEREAQRLEKDLDAIEGKILEAKKQLRSSPHLDSPEMGAQVSPVTALKTELAQKRAIYSKSHPTVKRLEAQLAAVEKLDFPSAPATVQTSRSSTAADDAIDALITQRASLQRNVENANQKLTAARLGESLERDQFSERLEVLEQAIVPQKPIKPNRPKLVGLTSIAAMMAGLAGVMAIEAFDKTIRRSRDLLRLPGASSIVIIPYLATKAELVRTKRRIVAALFLLLLAVGAGVAAVHFLFRPLDELWPLLLARVLG